MQEKILLSLLSLLFFFPQCSYIALVIILSIIALHQIFDFKIFNGNVAKLSNLGFFWLVLLLCFVAEEHLSSYYIIKTLRDFFDMSLTNPSNQPLDKFSTLILLLFPALLLVAKQTNYKKIMAIAFVGFIITNPMFASKLAFAVAILSLIIGYYSSFLLLRLVIFIPVIVMLTTPLLFPVILYSQIGTRIYEILTLSWKYRVDMWRLCLDYINQNFFFGIGFGGSRTITDLNSDGDLVMHLHPHDGFIQIWLELGLIGAVAFSSLFIILFFYLRKLPQIYVNTYSMLIVIYLTYFSFSFSYSTIWFLSSVMIAIITTKILLDSEKSLAISK